MKRVGIISTAILFVFLGITAPAYAQKDEHEKEAKPAQQSQPSKGGQEQQHAQQAPKGGSAQQGQRAQQAQRSQQPKPTQQQHPQQAQQTRAPQQQHAQAQRSQQPKPAQQQHPQEARQTAAPQQQHAQTQQNESGQRQQVRQVAGNRGGRIPDDRFRANFGHTHEFRINRPTIVGGASRFQYGGYWFGFGQPWPVGWLYSDEVYVDYIDGGYFLYDPVHPGIRISINVI